MSHAAVDWARADRTTTGNQRLLLLELAHYIDGNGEGWAARDRLLWGANMSLSSYRRALIALQRAGLVGVIVHGGGRGTGNDQYRPNAYYFLPMMSRDRIRTLLYKGRPLRRPLRRPPVVVRANKRAPRGHPAGRRPGIGV